MKAQFLIAAPSSNSGKTTLTLGLLRLLHNRGLKAQPFKCGPDYIDTKHHTLAAKKQSINLDTFMMSHEHVTKLYSKYSANADVVITEGVMGLFDGANRMQGSSAEIAMLLNLPVILVVNAKAMAYSVAPILYGFKHFNKEVKIAGVIFNFVNTESHYRFLKEACEDVGLEALGYIPINDAIKIPSRYLGLAISLENDYDAMIEQAALHISKTVNIKRLLEMSLNETVNNDKEEVVDTTHRKNKLKITIARDDAFNFTYYENIEAFKRLGEVTFFSPINDITLPETDLLYLAGGYPELFLNELSANKQMREAVKAFCNHGGKVIAECGGMMYLGKSIVDKDGKGYPMCGFLDIETSMKEAKLSLGYRTIKINGKIGKGHEFHYSTCKELGVIYQIGEAQNAKGEKVNTPIYKQKNVTASYVHFYWGENSEMINAIIQADFMQITR